MTDWEAVVAATEGHTIATIDVRLDEGRSWTYIGCSCGEQNGAFTEAWEFTDHIRRIVFEALSARQGEPIA